MAEVSILVGIAVVAGCAARAPVGAVDAPDPTRTDTVRRYTIWFGGARIGDATEREAWTATGVSLVRDEHIRFARGEAVVELETTVAIDADRALAPTRVAWSERGQAPRSAVATRDARGWHASGGQVLPGDAIPGELAELIARRDGRFAGAVFLPARGFVAGTGRIDTVSPKRMVARLDVAGVTTVATIDVADDGSPRRVIAGDGVNELRASEAEIAAGYPLADLIAAAALPVGARGRALVVDTDLAVPQPPGQRVSTRDGGGVVMELGAALPGALPSREPGADRTAEIAALLDDVRARVVPDLGAGPTTAANANAAIAGDCTTFALAYAALAERAGIATQVVTGFRVDGERLVRHRWATSWTGRGWVAVDVAFGELPAGGELVGIAVTDASDAALVAADSALAHVRAARWMP